jgi:hypothetical protein
MNATMRREEYVARLREQMNVWNAVLNAQRELATRNLRLLEGASAGAWAELCQGADDAWERMRLAAAAAGTYFDELPVATPPKARPRTKAKAKRS